MDPDGGRRTDSDLRSPHAEPGAAGGAAPFAVSCRGISTSLAWLTGTSTHSFLTTSHTSQSVHRSQVQPPFAASVVSRGHSQALPPPPHTSHPPTDDTEQNITVLFATDTPSTSLHTLAQYPPAPGALSPSRLSESRTSLNRLRSCLLCVLVLLRESLRSTSSHTRSQVVPCASASVRAALKASSSSLEAKRHQSHGQLRARRAGGKEAREGRATDLFLAMLRSFLELYSL